jgi:hypothetical protein
LLPDEPREITAVIEAVAEQSRIDGGVTGSGDPFVAFSHDVPRALADEALSNERSESETAHNTLGIVPDKIASGPCVALSRTGA